MFFSLNKQQSHLNVLGSVHIFRRCKKKMKPTTEQGKGSEDFEKKW